MSVLRAAYLRNKAVEYAWTFLHLPYVWGGDDFSGYDCSGFVHEILQAVGLESHGADSSASDLFERFKNREVACGYSGCLVFWFENDRPFPLPQSKAIHVMLMIDDMLCLGAAGGGSKTDSIEDAIKQNAFIKVRPVNYRGQGYVIVDPFKTIEGV